MMKQEKNEVLLTADELAIIGSELVDITQEIALNNITINGLEVARRKDPEAFSFLVIRYFETTHRINEKISRKLDDIACMLLNADDEKELEGFRNDK